MTAPSASARITLRSIRKWVKQGEKFAMLTCYDATTAAWLARGGVPCLLVGDTAAQVILGHDSTLPATMAIMLELTAAVRRGAPDCFLMADMPFGSYHCGDDQAMAHAISFLSQGQADAVKLECARETAPLVRRMAAAGVPVVAHLGSRPQQVRAQGGYRAVGRNRTEAAELVELASLFIAQGASMLLLEAVPAQVSQQITLLAQKSQPQPIPVIGCGGGPACHGHVVVLQDLLGMSPWQPPFAKPLAHLGPAIATAAGQWVELIRSGAYLREDHPYRMEEEA